MCKMAKHQHGQEAVFGLVTNQLTWRMATVLMQMLQDVQTSLPLVVFNSTSLSGEARRSILALGAQIVSLVPAMPIPSGWLPHIRRGNGGAPAWSKLGLWSQTKFGRIILVDLDSVVLENIDEMGSFPGDTFSPDVCKTGCDQLAAGLNTGTMVIQPSRERFDSMVRFAEARAAALRQVSDGLRTKLARALLSDADQSFLRAYLWEVQNASVGASHPSRNGSDWTFRTFHTSRCRGRAPRSASSPLVNAWRAAACGVGVVNFMSRAYNARPFDCDRCSSQHLKPKIVHYACHPYKPWVNKVSVPLHAFQ